MQRLGHSWTRKCTKVQDSTKNLSLMCKHYYKPTKFNTRIFTRVTHQASKKVLSRIKGEALRLLRTNSPQLTLEESMKSSRNVF